MLADVRTYSDAGSAVHVRAPRAVLRTIRQRRARIQRLPTLYLGYPGLVRGYDPGSFEAGECGAQTDGSCPAFDRLIGSRVAIANAELRFPLWGAFGGEQLLRTAPDRARRVRRRRRRVGRTMPSRQFTGGDHKPVSSVGAAARINLFGFAVAEIDYVRPLDRPGRGWLWQFNLMPGF